MWQRVLRARGVGTEGGCRETGCCVSPVLLYPQENHHKLLRNTDLMTRAAVKAGSRFREALSCRVATVSPSRFL